MGINKGEILERIIGKIKKHNRLRLTAGVLAGVAS